MQLTTVILTGIPPNKDIKAYVFTHKGQVLVSTTIPKLLIKIIKKYLSI